MTDGVRAASPADAEAMLAVVWEAFSRRPALDPPAAALTETVGTLAQKLATGGGLVLERRGRIAAGLVLDPADEVLYLRRVAVLPDDQHHGLAHRLVVAAVAVGQGSGGGRQFRELAVFARKELPANVAFWRDAGFREVAHVDPHVELRLPLCLRCRTATAADTRALGRSVAARLRAGDLVVLTGDLGAGKTTFAQGLGEGLGVVGEVTSPTFVIARVHPSAGEGPDLVHADAYRLGGAAELDDLDLDTTVGEAVTVVEWGEGLAEGLAEERLDVRISRTPGWQTDDPQHPVDARHVELRPFGTVAGRRWWELHDGAPPCR